MNQDEEHLNLLSIFHYVVGGITAFFSCFPLIHLAMGIAILSGAFDGPPFQQQGAQPVNAAPPKFFGVIIIAVATVIILSGWTLAILVIVAGRKLSQRVSRTFCLVVAGLECVLVPFGTVLGVFTIVVLSRDSVRSLFSSNNGAMAGGPGTENSWPQT